MIYFYEEQNLQQSKTQKTQKLNKSLLGLPSGTGYILPYDLPLVLIWVENKLIWDIATSLNFLMNQNTSSNVNVDVIMIKTSVCPVLIHTECNFY